MAFFFAHLLKPAVKDLVFFTRWWRGCRGCSCFCCYTIGLWIEGLSKRAWRIYTFSNSFSWKHVCLVCCCLHSVSDETSVSLNVSQSEESFVWGCCVFCVCGIKPRSDVPLNLCALWKLNHGQCIHLPMGGAHSQNNCSLWLWKFCMCLLCFYVFCFKLGYFLLFCGIVDRSFFST